MFCPAFRRLQNKNTGTSLTHNDNIRTRLSHSVEVAQSDDLWERSLVALLLRGLSLTALRPIVLAILFAACLAHDIGNPPFGHAGEDAIKDWFATTSAGQSILKGMKSPNGMISRTLMATPKALEFHPAGTA